MTARYLLLAVLPLLPPDLQDEARVGLDANAEPRALSIAFHEARRLAIEAQRAGKPASARQAWLVSYCLRSIHAVDPAEARRFLDFALSCGDPPAPSPAAIERHPPVESP